MKGPQISGNPGILGHQWEKLFSIGLVTPEPTPGHDLLTSTPLPRISPVSSTPRELGVGEAALSTRMLAPAPEVVGAGTRMGPEDRASAGSPEGVAERWARAMPASRAA